MSSQKINLPSIGHQQINTITAGVVPRELSEIHVPVLLLSKLLQNIEQRISPFHRTADEVPSESVQKAVAPFTRHLDKALSLVVKSKKFTETKAPLVRKDMSSGGSKSLSLACPSLLPTTRQMFKADNHKNKKFNAALKEAELAYNDKSNNCPKHKSAESDTAYQKRQLSALEVAESKIQEHEMLNDHDLETSLSLAAEVGNALLSENSKLKEDLYIMTIKNSQLARRISDSGISGLNIHQAEIEKLKEEKEVLLNRNSVLVDTINQIEAQLAKEKELRSKLECIFEEHDKEKEHIISSNNMEIARLQEVIKQIKTPNENKISDRNSSPTAECATNDAETQTNIDSLPSQGSLLLQLVELRVRLDEMKRKTTEPVQNCTSVTLHLDNLNKRQDHIEQQLRIIQDCLYN
ncbi:hypothetical protein J6590_056354 [Homalodisca vitripennis]|nr:hypothetical protein J6590_056354 [Homalodisca vitripennis]